MRLVIYGDREPRPQLVKQEKPVQIIDIPVAVLGGAQVSNAPDNALTSKPDGLFVPQILASTQW